MTYCNKILPRKVSEYYEQEVQQKKIINENLKKNHKL